VTRLARLPLAVGLCLVPALASAARSPDPAVAASELQLGARDEAGGAFSRALGHYRACIEAAPSSRLARNARARVTWIEARSEGGFEPLARLAHVRRDPGPLGDPSALARLTTEAESMPAGLVRSELRLRIAEGWLKLGHRAQAAAELQRVVSDPSSGGGDRTWAERDLVESLLAAGRLDAARDEVAAHPFDPKSAADVARLLRRRRLERLTAGGLLTLVALGGGAGFLSRRRRRPGGLRPLRSWPA
jgi:hypothetical protein